MFFFFEALRERVKSFGTTLPCQTIYLEQTDDYQREDPKIQSFYSLRMFSLLHIHPPTTHTLPGSTMAYWLDGLSDDFAGQRAKMILEAFLSTSVGLGSVTSSSIPRKLTSTTLVLSPS
jgi:hypothetical protein